MNALVIGGSSWDYLIGLDEITELHDDMSLWAKSFHQTVGGTGAGKAIALDRLGADVTLLTPLANDDHGKKIYEFYKKTNIDVQAVIVDKTVSHTNLMHGRGKRITVTTHNYSNSPKYFDDIEKLIDNADIVFLNINDFAREYIEVIKKSKVLCFVDIHDYNPGNPYHQDFIDAADILVASDVYIENKNDFFGEMIERGSQLVVLTSGDKGLIAKDNTNNIYQISGYNDMDFVDSNGAGDSFCSGFAYAMYKGFSIRDSLDIGSICGGLACSSKELFPRISIETVIKIHKKRSE